MGEKHLISAWLSINEDLAINRKINCTKMTHLKNIRIYLYKVGCKRDSKASEIKLKSRG
jgi:hypothetical protein